MKHWFEFDLRMVSNHPRCNLVDLLMNDCVNECDKENNYDRKEELNRVFEFEYDTNTAHYQTLPDSWRIDEK